jgi:rRNA maturation protein Nop10
VKTAVARIACTWCGQYTPPGAACQTCGSPIKTGFAPLAPGLTMRERSCPHCGALTFQSICEGCRGALEALRSLSELSLDLASR